MDPTSMQAVPADRGQLDAGVAHGTRARRALWRGAIVACVLAARAVPAGAAGTAAALPRSDFHADCPFLVAAPSVLAVFEARRWRDMLAAARGPLAYDAAATDFRRESIIVVTLPRSRDPIAGATLSTRRSPERFEEKTGTLMLWFDVQREVIGAGGGAASAGLGYRACIVTWTERRRDLEQVIARTSDGTYIAGARVAPRPKKKPPTESR